MEYNIDYDNDPERGPKIFQALDLPGKEPQTNICRKYHRFQQNYPKTTPATTCFGDALASGIFTPKELAYLAFLGLRNSMNTHYERITRRATVEMIKPLEEKIKKVMVSGELFDKDAQQVEDVPMAPWIEELLKQEEDKDAGHGNVPEEEEGK